MSRVSASIATGPRGLVDFMPLITAIALSPSMLPAELLGHFVDDLHRVVAGDRHEVRAARFASFASAYAFRNAAFSGESCAAE